MSRIYLDNNATTSLDPEVAEAINDAHGVLLGNPASQHWAGRESRVMLEDAREIVADVLGACCGSAAADQVIFTSGGTEANNLALRGLATQHPGAVIVSAIEHPSILEVARNFEREGRRALRLPVDRAGVLSLEGLVEGLAAEARVVSVMLANNETGVLQPVAEAAQLCREAGVPIHTDAVQAIGKIPVSFEELGVDAMSIGAHKFHGPVGIGALLVRRGVRLEPMLLGGFQQFGCRPGTEPVALAVGMARALTLWRDRAEHRRCQLEKLRDELERNLRVKEPGLVVHGEGAPRVPQTSCISFPQVDGQRLVMALDLAGIACSTGSACASGSSEPSHVLAEMRLADDLIQSAIRFSVSHSMTTTEIASAADRIYLVYRDLRGQVETRKRGSTARQRLP